MAIRLPNANPQTSAKVRRALEAFDAGLEPPLGSSTEGGGAAAVPPPAPLKPIPIYAPTLQAPSNVEDCDQIGWRYLIVNSDRVGAVDVTTQKGSQPEMVGDASLSERLTRAARLAQHEVETAGGEDDYEMRLLDLSRIGDSLIWLRSETAPDRFFTYSDEPQEVAATQVIETIEQGAADIQRAVERAEHHPESGG